ncbi:hypothetical protein [Actinomyces graevenitzii]|nr:hypothetical protein [Actinomyces graevenitzii]
MSTNRPNASIWDDDEGEAQLRPMMRKNNAHLFDDEPPVSSLSAASAASAAAAVAGYTASSAAEANAASALSAPSAYSVGSASSALSARSAGSASSALSARSAVSASSAAVPSAASAAAPEAAGAAVSAPTPDSAGSAPLSARSGATPDAAPNAASAQSGAPNAASAQSGAPNAASAPAMPPSQAPKSAPSAPVNGPVLGTTPSVHVPASSLANNGVPAMLANTPPAAGRRYTNAENAHTSGTFDSAARRATATTAATSATASTGASALTAASAAAASVTAQSPASATSANAPELADAAKPAVADAGATNPGSGAVRRRSLFTAVPQPVPVDEDSDDETIQVPVVREDLIPDSFSAASAVSASAASASATSAAESASAAETVSAAETTSAAETSSSVSAASAPSSLEHSSAATSPASASDDVAPESAVQADQADQEAVDSVQELNDAHEVEAAAVPLPTDFDAPSAISIPTPPHTVSSALSAESTFSIDSAVSAASAASSTGIILPTPAAPVTAAPPVPVTTAASAPVTASPATSSKANKLSDLPAPSDLPSPSEPAPAADVADLPAPPAPTGHGASAFTSDDEVVASDHTETTIMDAADMELEEVVKPVVTSTSPVGVERLDHLATADSADLAPVAPSPSSAIFASTRTAAFSDSANQSDADNEVDDDVLLAGSTVVGKPASRAAAHWGGTLLALVLFPIAWFLMHTAANALTGALADGWPKVFSTAGIIELGMAIVLLIVVMATATRSSLGTFVTGITTLLIGLPFVVVPSITKQYLGDFLANMALQSRFGRILSEAILLDGVSGRLVIIGLFLIMLGVVSHSTRRAGRRERLVMDRANTKK